MRPVLAVAREVGADVAATVIDVRANRPIYLRDIANVSDGVEEITNRTRINYGPGIRIALYKQSGANTVGVANAVRAEMEQINADFPDLRVTTIIDTRLPSVLPCSWAPRNETGTIALRTRPSTPSSCSIRKSRSAPLHAASMTSFSVTERCSLVACASSIGTSAWTHRRCEDTALLHDVGSG